MIGFPLLLVVIGQVQGSTAAPPRPLAPPPLIAAPAPSATSAGGQPAIRPGQISERRQAEMRAMIEKRKARRAKGTASRTQVLEGIRQNQQSAAAAAALNAAQTQQAYSNNQQSGAMAGISAAMQRQADIDRARYVLQSQQAGVPQVFVPGQGMMPYAYGVASPTPTYVIQGNVPPGTPGFVAPAGLVSPP